LRTCTTRTCCLDGARGVWLCGANRVRRGARRACASRDLRERRPPCGLELRRVFVACLRGAASAACVGRVAPMPCGFRRDLDRAAAPRASTVRLSLHRVARTSEYRAHLRQYPGVTCVWTRTSRRCDPGRAFIGCVYTFSRHPHRQVMLQRADIAASIPRSRARVASSTGRVEEIGARAQGAAWYGFRSSGPRWKPHGGLHGGGAGGPRVWRAWLSSARSPSTPAI
jgi:hypothetical protein